jgi:predicted dehydrogenase
MTYRVGIVGCGRMGSRLHAPAFAAQPDCRIVGTTSRTREKAEELARSYGAETYADVAELLAKASPDVLVITTPDSAHLEPLAAALAAGIHVFVEKPLHAAGGQEWVTWDDYEAAARVLAGWDRAHSVVGINFNYRTMPHYRQLATDIAAGELGTPTLVDAAAHLNCWSHTIDLLRWWCGDVREVFAYWDVSAKELRRVVSLRFASGAIGTLVGASYDYRDELVRVEIHGTKARGLVAGLNGAYERRVEEQSAPDTVWPRKDFASDNFGPSFRASIDAFCDALRSGRRAPVDGDDALAELAIEAAIYRSATTGAPVSVPVARR